MPFASTILAEVSRADRHDAPTWSARYAASIEGMSSSGRSVVPTNFEERVAHVLADARSTNA
jgi:hypothetical protein